MPKIEVYNDDLSDRIGKRQTIDELEELLTVAKAEIDDVDDETGVLKIELNDTNRPDLWSTAGLARQLRSYLGGKADAYDFFSSAQVQRETSERVVEVDENIRLYRPYVAAFAVAGRGVEEAELKDIIQTQEKLCWNFGQKRSSIAMGVYRNDLIRYPVRYRGADPDQTRFVPLQSEREMTLREILADHDKGREFGHIVAGFPVFPFIEDADGEVLSFPPVINSAHLGAVKIGDENLFVEMTGTNLRSLELAVSIVACDLADSGYTILPVKTVYPYDTEFGREVVSPYYFQHDIEVDLPAVHKMLGQELTIEEVLDSLKRMGIDCVEDDSRFTITIPPFRNDFLHPVDVIEDIMIGYGTNSFDPVMPSEFTAGRISEEELFARSVRSTMVGLKFQEMIYFYLGSKREFVDRMRLPGDDLVHIANPMTENYEYLRNSILPSLLNTESVSAHAPYPHDIFEVGKITRLDDKDNQGSVTKNSLGFLSVDRKAGFNEVSATVQAIFYYLSREFDPAEADDPRFISGRCVQIVQNGSVIGIYGEVHPEVLENWSIQMPCVACEIDLDSLLEL